MGFKRDVRQTGVVLGVMTDMWRAVVVYLKANSFNQAASIAFFMLFSLAPLMLLMTALMGFFLGTNVGMQDKVLSILKAGIPYLSDRMIADIKGLSVRWKTFGWVGAVALIASSELVLMGVTEALSSVFGTTEKYGFIRKKILNLGVLAIAIFGSLLSVAITAGSRILGAVEVVGFEVFGIEPLRILLQSVVFKVVLPFIVVTLCVGFVYRIIAGRAIGLKAALKGAVVFALLWEAAKYLFAWYLEWFPSYNRYYGSIGAIMIALLWVFYAANIFIFGACYAEASNASVRGANRGR